MFIDYKLSFFFNFVIYKTKKKRLLSNYITKRKGNSNSKSKYLFFIQNLIKILQMLLPR